MTSPGSKDPKRKYGQAVSNPLVHFKDIPWCAKLFEDPTVLKLQIPNRTPIETREFSLVNETLNTHDTVRACVVMIRKTKPTAESVDGGETTENPFLELLGLLDLGQGVNGYPGTVHGGFFNVILDEVMGSTVNVYCQRLAFTAYLNVKFKKPLRTPQVVVVRGQVKKVEGRKVFVKGSVEAKGGVTFAEAEGLWIIMEAKPVVAPLTGKI